MFAEPMNTVKSWLQNQHCQYSLVLCRVVQVRWPMHKAEMLIIPIFFFFLSFCLCVLQRLKWDKNPVTQWRMSLYLTASLVHTGNSYRGLRQDWNQSYDAEFCASWYYLPVELFYNQILYPHSNFKRKYWGGVLRIAYPISHNLSE